MELREAHDGSVAVRYAVRGEGPPLLLVHGWINDQTVWNGVLPLLAQQFRCLVVDLPGFGKSDKPSPDDYPYDVAAFARAAVAVLDAEGVQRSHLCGHSMGGGVSLVIAGTYPERIDRLVVVAPAVYPVPWTFKAAVARTPVIGPFIFEYLYRRKAVYEFLREEGYSGHDTIDMQQVAYLYRVFNPLDARRAAHASLMRTLSRLEPVERCIPRVRNETLVLWGSDDRLMPPAYGPRLAQALPHARLQVMDGACHVCFEEFPEQGARHIMAHLAGGAAGKLSAAEPS